MELIFGMLQVLLLLLMVFQMLTTFGLKTVKKILLEITKIMALQILLPFMRDQQIPKALGVEM
jgi:hypothetical protein